MSDEVVRLVTELVTEQVSAASKKMAADYKQSVAEMDRATKQAGQGVDGLGFRMDGAGKLAIRAGKALSAGIGAATAAAAGAERSFIGLGTAILSSFAAGGPIVGGIATVAGGIGLLVGRANEAREKFLAMASAASSAVASMRASFQERGLGAEQYGQTSSTLLQRKLSALQGEAQGLNALGEAVSAGGEQAQAAAVLSLRRRIVDEERKGTAEGREQAKHLSDQLELLTKFMSLLGQLSSRLANLHEVPQERTFLGFMRKLGEPQPNDRIREDAEPLIQLAQQLAQMVGIGKQANAGEQGVVTDQDRVATLMRLQAIDAARLKGAQEMEALQRAFDGEMGNVVAKSQQVEQIDAQIANLRAIGTDEAKEAIPALQAQRDAAAALARWLITAYNPEVGKRAVDDLIAQKTALTDAAKMAQAYAEWLRTAQGYSKADIGRYGALVAGQMHLADTKDALRRSDTAAGFAAQAAAQRAGALGLVTDTIALESQLAQLEARRTALAHERADLTSEEVKDLDLQISGTRMLLEVARQQPLFQFIAEGAQTMAQTIAGSLVAGFREGGRAAAEVWRKAIDTIIQNTLTQVVQSGLNMILASLFGGGGAAGGGGGILAALGLGGGGGGGAFSGATAQGAVNAIGSAVGDCPG